jgi:signal transduction histidine kinase
LIFFFILHVIIAAILFRPANAWLFAAAATVGMTGLALAESKGWVAHYPVSFRGQAIDINERSAYVAALLVFFAASVFVTAALTAAIMRRLRGRVRELAESTGEIASLNEKLNSLYTMLSTVGSERRLDRILDVVTSELAIGMGVTGVAVKLLSEDGTQLHFAAAHGLPKGFADQKTVEVARSPLNRRVIDGETLVFGRVSGEETFQLMDDLRAAGISSVVFAPLRLEDRVIGILGAYCGKPDCFGPDDAGFLRLAAELVAVAIENARSYEAVEGLMKDRSQFMLRVAHNMRAPLTASMSMLDALRDGYLGDLEDRKQEHLQRVDRRLQTLNRTVGELLTLARNRERAGSLDRRPVDLRAITERVERTFRNEADRREIAFQVHFGGELPRISGDRIMIEQMLENLVSNAVEYTPSGGSVDVTLGAGEPNHLRIEIRDTGIGIPIEEQPKLFSEFFRATNARTVSDHGTGLGLALVKQTVDLHGGTIRVESKVGEGTTFTIDLPASFA